MGVVNIKSSSITNADATPRVPNNGFVADGMLHSAVATVEIAAADSDGSTYRMLRLPSGARLQSLKVYCDAITAGTAFDFGIYKTAADGGAVVSDNVFANNVDLSSAITTGTEVLFQALDIAKIEQRLWELLSLSVDPFIEYDLVLTGDTVGSAAGTVSIAVSYVL